MPETKSDQSSPSVLGPFTTKPSLPASVSTPVIGANTFLPIDPDRHDGTTETKIILLSGFSDKELHAVIDAYRLNKAMPAAIFATVTELSENFKVKDLLVELELEKKQIEAAQELKTQTDAAALKNQDAAQK